MLAWRVCSATSLLKFTAKALPTSNTHHTRKGCLKPLLQVIDITHVGGVLTPKKQACSAALNNQLDLAHISYSSLFPLYKIMR